MGNPEIVERRISRRTLLTGGILTDKEKVSLVSPIPMFATVYRPADVDRIDLLSIHGQQKSIRNSGSIGMKLGAVIGALCGLDDTVKSRRKFLQKFARGAVDGSVTGTIFGASIPPLMGATGEIDVHLVQPLLNGKTSAEALEGLRIEKQQAVLKRQ